MQHSTLLYALPQHKRATIVYTHLQSRCNPVVEEHVLVLRPRVPKRGRKSPQRWTSGREFMQRWRRYAEQQRQYHAQVQRILQQPPP